jgi:hypothetical protein
MAKAGKPRPNAPSLPRVGQRQGLPLLLVVPRHPRPRVCRHSFGVLEHGQKVGKDGTPFSSAVWIRLMNRSPTPAPCWVLQNREFFRSMIALLTTRSQA